MLNGSGETGRPTVWLTRGRDLAGQALSPDSRFLALHTLGRGNSPARQMQPVLARNETIYQ